VKYSDLAKGNDSPVLHKDNEAFFTPAVIEALNKINIYRNTSEVQS